MVTIISATTYNRPDFIPLQYNSIKKHVKGDFKYIVVNNARFSSIDNHADSEKCFNEIEKICEDLGIDHYPVTVCPDVLKTCTTGSIVNGKYTHDSYACCYSVQWTFLHVISKLKGKVYIVDADLFFIKDVDLDKMLEGYDLAYIPQYRRGSELVTYMWNMFAGFNTDRNSELLKLNWSNGMVQGTLCDVGGMTHNFLKDNTQLKNLYLEEFALYDILNNQDGSSEISLSINGNINYILTLNSLNELTKITISSPNDKLCEKKSFYYEKDFVDYNEYLNDCVVTLLNVITQTKECVLPNPIRLGFVKRFDTQEYFALHYRSSANYLDYATQEYNNEKTTLLKKLLNQNND